MNTKQKKTLLGAIVATILVGTIIVVVLAVNGNFRGGSGTPPTPPSINADAIKEVVKAVKDIMEKAGQEKQYKGGVYIKIQAQWLNKDGKVTQKKREEHGDEKRTHMVLKELTVYAAKHQGPNGPSGTEAVYGPYALEGKLIGEKDKMEEEKTVVVIRSVKFKHEVVDVHKSYPVVKKLKEEKFELGLRPVGDMFLFPVKAGDPDTDMMDLYAVERSV